MIRLVVFRLEPSDAITTLSVKKLHGPEKVQSPERSEDGLEVLRHAPPVQPGYANIFNRLMAGGALSNDVHLPEEKSYTHCSTPPYRVQLGDNKDVLMFQFTLPPAPPCDGQYVCPAVSHRPESVSGVVDDE